MTSKYLIQSSFQSALFLDQVLSKKTAKTLALTCGILAALFLVSGVFLTAKIFISLAEFTAALFLIALVYAFFVNYLESAHGLTVEEVKIAFQSGQYGKGLGFAAAKAVNASADENFFPPAKFFKYLCRQADFLWVLRRLGIDLGDFIKKLEIYTHQPSPILVSEILKGAWQQALSVNRLTFGVPDMLVSLYQADQNFQKILFDLAIQEDDLKEVGFWQDKLKTRQEAQSKFWRRENLLSTKGIGKDWASGYTISLDRFAVDITRQVQYQSRKMHLYGHGTGVELLSRMLLQGQGQVAVIGEPGVGRHTMIQAFAQALNTGQIYSPLRYMRILQIDSASVVAGANNLNEVVQRIETLFSEAYRARNIILVINDIDAFLDSRQEAGRVNATESLLPYFESPLKIVGITTPGGFQATIGKNPQLSRYFSKLELHEPSPAETLWILEDVSRVVEQKTGVFFTLPALKETVSLANRLIQNLPNPEKSIEILENTAIHVATNTPDRAVTVQHVQHVVSQRTKIPVEQVSGPEKDKLLILEELLHQRIIGQNEAITTLANALRRARSGIRSEKKPIGGFLFLGPTGVGKTETTKALAALYFGSEQRILRFDMSEFQEVRSISRFIGNAETGEGGVLTEGVIANPFSLILLDEIEKAHPKILDIFLQVLDEGRLTDAAGRTVSFVHTMIIATSNAGAEVIRTMVKNGKNPADEQNRNVLLDFLQKQGIFRPEFLNRFDAVLVFRPLTPEELYQVSQLMLQELNSRLKEKDIQIKITPELTSWLVQNGYHPEFGARPLRRFIQENIENYIAQGLLSGTIKRGDLVDLGSNMLESKHE